MAAPAPARASGNASVEITGAAACSYIVNTNNQQCVHEMHVANNAY